MTTVKDKREAMRKKNAGVALLTALGALVIFTLLGSAYAGYMALEKQRVDYDLSGIRARAAAEAGVEAAIGAAGRALAAGQSVPSALEPLRVPLYRPTDDGGVAVDDGRWADAKVSIADESGRINLNYAPTRVLSAILSIDPNQAREIRTHLPRLESDDPSAITANNARWLASVDELETRQLVGPGALEGVNRDYLTVYTGGTDGNAGWLNVNSAPAPVLAAVLGISLEAAEQVRQAGPYTAPGQLAAAAGKEVSTFNVRPPANDPAGLPRELAFASRCYRIVSHAVLTENDLEKAGSRIEAVVYFDADGRPEIRYWNESPGIKDESPAETAGAA